MLRRSARLFIVLTCGADAVRQRDDIKLEAELEEEQAGLNEQCYPQDGGCPPGSVRKKAKVGSYEYCSCNEGKFVAKTPDTSNMGNAQAYAANAKALTSCAVALDSVFDSSWFKVSNLDKNSGCVCSEGVSGLPCAETTQLTLHTSQNRATSKLTCDKKEKICKVKEGDKCNFKHQFKGEGPSDCEGGTTCGAISERCVDSMTALLEKNIMVAMSNSLFGDYKASVAISAVINAVASGQMSASDGWNRAEKLQH
jgi:hypothetical protein